MVRVSITNGFNDFCNAIKVIDQTKLIQVISRVERMSYTPFQLSDLLCCVGMSANLHAKVDEGCTDCDEPHRDRGK